MTSLLRRTARTAIHAGARDVTATRALRPALVLAPHPDDETLGCGATIARKVAHSTAVTVAVLTDGSASHHSPTVPPLQLAALRRQEMTEAARRLGLPAGALCWAGIPDGRLADYEYAAVDFIAALISRLRPAEVYTTSTHESHPDHAALGRAARRAVAGIDGVQLLEYPVWLWAGWPFQKGRRISSGLEAATMALGRRAERVRAGEFLPAKLHALAAHRSQLHRPDDVPPDEDWAVLPPQVIDAASAPDELFFPWHGRVDHRPGVVNT